MSRGKPRSRLLAGPVRLWRRFVHAGGDLLAGIVTLWKGLEVEHSVSEELELLEGPMLEQEKIETRKQCQKLP